MAFRTQPTVTDVHMSLVTIGGPQSAALVEYAKRSNKRHLTRRENITVTVFIIMCSNRIT